MFFSLKSLKSKRARHEAEIAKIRKEMQTMEQEHQVKVSEIERNLIESRFKVQKEADAKLSAMQSEAHDRAVKYLIQHTETLELENVKLEKELDECNRITQEQITRRHQLEKENRELEREQRLRKDLLKIRLTRIEKAQKQKEQQERLEKNQKKQEKKKMVERVLKVKGQSTGLEVIDPLNLEWSDEDSDEVLS